MTARNVVVFQLISLILSASAWAAAPYDFVSIRNFVYQARRFISDEIGGANKWKDQSIFFAEKYRLERDPENPDREVLVDMSELWYVVRPEFSRPSAAMIAFVLEADGSSIKYIPWESKGEMSVTTAPSTEFSFLSTAENSKEINSVLAKFNLSSSQVMRLPVNSNYSSTITGSNTKAFKYVIRDLDPETISRIMQSLGKVRLAGHFQPVPSEDSYTQAFAPKRVFNEGGSRFLNIASLRETEARLAHPVVYKKLRPHLEFLMSKAPCPEAFEIRSDRLFK